MIINRSSRFKRAFQKLPPHIQDDFIEKIRRFASDPFDPRLHTHKLKGKLHECYSLYLKDGYRVLFEFAGNDEVNFIAVGPHDQYTHWER